MTNKAALNCPTEGEEQATLFSWARMYENKYPQLKWMFHIPNEGKRSRTTGGRMRSEGVKSGVADIFSPAKKKRSLNANAYAWKLINDIALAVREKPESVYREALKNVPNICEVLCVQDKAVDSMERLWTRDHIGRRVEREQSRIKGCTNLYIYYGSSDFDTRQMAMLIDGLIQDARALGIETRPEEEIKSLLEAWECLS